MNDLMFAQTRFSLLWTVFLNWTLTLFLCTVWRFCSLEAHHSEHSYWTGPVYVAVSLHVVSLRSRPTGESGPRWENFLVLFGCWIFLGVFLKIVMLIMNKASPTANVCGSLSKVQRSPQIKHRIKSAAAKPLWNRRGHN